MTTKPPRTSILAAPGARALLGSSILARLPLAMFSIALLVHAQQLTGSFAVAGAVSGAYALAGAAAAPLLGRLVDRCGQTKALVVCGAAVSALVLVATGLLPAGTPPAALVALAAVGRAPRRRRSMPASARCCRRSSPTRAGCRRCSRSSRPCSRSRSCSARRSRSESARCGRPARRSRSPAS